MAQTGKRGGRKPGGKKSAAAPVPERITFDYIRSNYFRVVSANGVLGAVTPNGEIHMGVWSQRSPYPEQTVHEIDSSGKLTEEVGRTSSDGYEREIEVALVFNAAAAVEMIKWLQRRLLELSTRNTAGTPDDDSDQGTEDDSRERVDVPKASEG